jgi:hypothetical protein
VPYAQAMEGGALREVLRMSSFAVGVGACHMAATGFRDMQAFAAHRHAQVGCGCGGASIVDSRS